MVKCFASKKREITIEEGSGASCAHATNALYVVIYAMILWIGASREDVVMARPK